jgi:two-component system chemotaxis response regulator CheB
MNMRKVRVLIVDDSVVIRRLVSEVLSGDPAIEVAGTAANGRIALAKLPQLNPDLVTLDIEMPEMDGLQTLSAIRKDYPRLPVIMFSTTTQRGALATLDALALGANDYVTKPANVGGVTAGIERVKDELIPKIKAFCPQVMATLERLRISHHGTLRPVLPPVQPAVAPSRRIDIVAIGVSTGGPNALVELLPVFPADFPVPVVIVQHMPPVFTTFLAERLASRSAIGVHEAADGVRLQAGEAWIAPGDFHMVLERNGVETHVRTHRGPMENSCRPSVDVLFRSVVELYGGGTLGVIMTGMGQDGLRGCEMTREHAGRVFVQDEATSVVWGMPGAVVRAGLADRVIPLGQLGSEIVRTVTSSRMRSASAPGIVLRR